MRNRLIVSSIILVVTLLFSSCLMLPPPSYHYAKIKAKSFPQDDLHLQFSKVTSVFGKQNHIHTLHELIIVNNGDYAFKIDSLSGQFTASNFIAKTGQLTYPRILKPSDTLKFIAEYKDFNSGGNRDLDGYYKSLENENLDITIVLNELNFIYKLKKAKDE